MVILIRETAEEGSSTAAELVARAIRKNPALRLGLAAGKTPVGLYRKLVELHQTDDLDFSAVHLFSLDEFVGLPNHSPNSFDAFFRRHLVDHIPFEPVPGEMDIAILEAKRARPVTIQAQHSLTANDNRWTPSAVFLAVGTARWLILSTCILNAI